MINSPYFSSPSPFPTMTGHPVRLRRRLLPRLAQRAAGRAQHHAGQPRGAGVHRRHGPQAHTLTYPCLLARESVDQPPTNQGQSPTATTLSHLSFSTQQTGRSVRVKPPGQTGVMMLRPRAWCMTEFHLHVNGRAVPGPLVDFGCVGLPLSSADHQGTLNHARTATDPNCPINERMPTAS